MTSTHNYQSLEADSKPSSRVLKPPGGGSSYIFGTSEEQSISTRQHRMDSNIFGSAKEPENMPKRSNPPGGKTSGIFQDRKPVQAAGKQNPQGGKSNDIFGDGKLPTSPKAHPNKPKDNISLKEPERPPPPPPAPTPEPTPEVKTPVAKEEKKKVAVPEVDLSRHEPHLGPRPRSHNRVLNPPGGKSSVTFY
ncbi:PREDICTED: hematological and neurological expressed 1-like protein [Nanorana parkeri]|uniref:hematological and neurological expressed 1-like protein n=1 Tax=Nanorana parkeri TaxID=125878 RepID=UPI0008549540|nr:PREDICTED: hematological and neurological expressed 1-like protein [Nanorana parkeri]